MDSEVLRDGRILDLIDDAWREDKLPYEDVTIPLNELPEPEQDNGGATESVKEQEMKWADLALQYLHENISSSGS
ncbi:anaphase-promoting complex subunit 13 [Xenopus tropicalis]|uniref:Anaphase-promoting complex subunit 13 n=1 Tax=Xenopus tropicalis TaxID=8364 RepID=APC13_XENTR|nr:anaphase-promoting complex subunit 13 [Xenopus tropicalis]Q28IW8.1 RecName: Full=Anaphase-promoting complex subunit 13; Short=APC13; AltName: Full=Cyclosome subunit 13 [Xenopus tropicalis]CAJ82693.1 anaphase promoting complex subunit 13 [Xenopus tropicalis]|eukprot:NP_001017240.1 anaphase-promoting complex subunit 13 [Xenopus tropicalis]